MTVMRIWRGTPDKRSVRKPKVLTYRGAGMSLVSENKIASPEQEKTLFNGILEELYGRTVTLR